MFPYEFWDSLLWKHAARAGLRQISKMVGSGDLSGASRLATTPGVLKPSAAGSQIKHLGQGSEGLATLVAHPDHGVAVRKLYDPRGISGSEMISRKEQAGRALGTNPNFAQFYGSSQTPHGNATMHFNEFIPQGQAPTGQAGAQSVRHTQVQAQRGLTQAGFAGGKDIRQGNMVYDARTNNHKVIDYIPAQKGEFMRMPQSRANVIAQSPSSTSTPWNANYQPSGSGTQGGMLGRLLGGKSQMGMRQTPLAPATSTSATAVGRATPSAGTMPMTPPQKPALGMNAGMGYEKTQPAAAKALGSAPTMPARPAASSGPGTTPQRPMAMGSAQPLKQTPAQMTQSLKPAAPATAPLKPPSTKPPATAPLRPPKPVTL